MSAGPHDSSLIFDRRQVRRQRDRAALRLADHDFLFREVAERMGDRLEGLRDRFPKVLALGGRAGDSLRAIAAPRGMELFVQIDPSLAVLGRETGFRVAAEADFLPFAGGRFDLVLSCLDLHWIDDLPGLLLQARAALRPDGMLLAAMLGGDTLYELRRALFEADTQITGGVSPRLSPLAGLRDAAGLLQRAGFALPVADADTVSVTYPDALALMRDLRGMGEGNAVAARSRRFARRDAIAFAAARYAELYGDAEGRIPATFEILYLTGWAPAATQQQPLRPGTAKHRLADALGTTEQPAGDTVPPRS